MWIKVWDWMGPTPTADRFLGQTMTDANGNWSLGPIANSDPDGTRLDVYFTFETSTYGSTTQRGLGSEMGSAMPGLRVLFQHGMFPTAINGSMQVG